MNGKGKPNNMAAKPQRMLATRFNWL